MITPPLIARRRFRFPPSKAFPALMLAFALGSVPSIAVAQDEANPLPEKVDGLLKKMSEHLAKAQTFALEADILFDEVLDSGVLIQRAAKLKLLGQRPGALRASFKSDTEERTVWYDGKTVTILDLDDQVQAKAEVPDKIGPAMDHLMDHYGISIALSDFLFENPYEALTESVGEAHYIGMSLVKGIQCHQLSFRQESIDWQLWIEDGGNPAPRKLLIVYKEIEGAPRYMATLTGVKLEKPIPASIFQAVIPDGITQIDLLELKPQSTAN